METKALTSYFNIKGDTKALEVGLATAAASIGNAVGRKTGPTLTEERIEELKRERRFDPAKGRTFRHWPLDLRTEKRDEIADEVAATCWGRPWKRLETRR